MHGYIYAQTEETKESKNWELKLTNYLEVESS